MSICPLCGRPLGVHLVESHHLIPRTFKGWETVDLHRICHQKIHSTFSERELLRHYHTIPRLLEHEQIRVFVEWVKTKPLEFYVKNDDSADRKKRRKR